MKLARILTIALLAVIPQATVAQGYTPSHFKVNGVTIAENQKVEILGSGKLTLINYSGTVSCHVIAGGTIWNPSGGGLGQDNVETLSAHNCVSEQCAGRIEVESSLLRFSYWYGILNGFGPELRIRFGEVNTGENGRVEFTIKCVGVKTTQQNYYGVLTPLIQNGNPTRLIFDERANRIGGGLGGPTEVLGSVWIAGAENDEQVTAE